MLDRSLLWFQLATATLLQSPLLRRSSVPTDPRRYRASFRQPDQEPLFSDHVPIAASLLDMLVSSPGRRTRPQRYDLEKSSMAHDVQTFYWFCEPLPARQAQNVQTDTFIEVLHWTRNRQSGEFRLHVFSTDIKMRSSCFLDCQLRSSTVFQHLDHFLHSKVSQVGMEFSQRLFHPFKILLGVNFLFCHWSVTLLVVLHRRLSLTFRFVTTIITWHVSATSLRPDRPPCHTSCCSSSFIKLVTCSRDAVFGNSARSISGFCFTFCSTTDGGKNTKPGFLITVSPMTCPFLKMVRLSSTANFPIAWTYLTQVRFSVHAGHGAPTETNFFFLSIVRESRCTHGWPKVFADCEPSVGFWRKYSTDNTHQEDGE